MLPQPDDDVRQRYLALRSQSAWDVIHERFEHPVTRNLVLWLAMATITDPRRPGTGFLPSSLAAGRLDFGWTTPMGGSQALPEALVRSIEKDGGQVVCSAAVTGISADSDGIRSVRVVGGQAVKVGRAVVAGGHLAKLGDMLEGREPTPDLVRARDTWRPGLAVMAEHAALKGDLTFGADRVPAAAAGLGTTGGTVAHLDCFAKGEYDTEDPWLLVVNQSGTDPTRVPESGGGTFKILTIAPYELSRGRDWADVKDQVGEQLVDLVRRRASGLEVDDILSMRTESPRDVAAHNPQNPGGSCYGGEFLLDGDVVPGWLRCDTDVPGLFLTSATTHPAGRSPAAPAATPRVRCSVSSASKREMSWEPAESRRVTLPGMTQQSNRFKLGSESARGPRDRQTVDRRAEGLCFTFLNLR